MGFRTVVMLNNDMAHRWQNDPELGRKVAHAMHSANSEEAGTAELDGYGQVVQCVHADSQTLAVLDGYTAFRPLAGRAWVRGESEQGLALKLVKAAAEKLGYRLVKRPRG